MTYRESIRRDANAHREQEMLSADEHAAMLDIIDSCESVADLAARTIYKRVIVGHKGPANPIYGDILAPRFSTVGRAPRG